MANIITVANVQGYLDAQNVAWLSAEDVARGFGFTYEKGGVEYVRWERINSYLESFGYFATSGENSQRVGKGDYLPENMVYRLGFKANNETAVRFQSILADDVLPSIRKTGQYTVKPLTPAQQLLANAQMLVEIEQRQMEQERRQLAVENKVALIEDRIRDNGYMTVKGFANIVKIHVGNTMANNLGRLAPKWCRQMKIKPEKIKNGEWGEINTYPMQALRDVFKATFPDKAALIEVPTYWG